MQTMQVTFGLAEAMQASYTAYIYCLVHKEMYQIMVKILDELPRQ